jgi:uncharacterized membrane protein
MVNSEELIKVFSEISDEELVRRYNSDGLTPLARDIAGKELDLRNINLNQFQFEDIRPSKLEEIKLKVKPVVTQILQFPSKVFDGSEPLWLVVMIGLVAAYIVNQLLLNFIFQNIITQQVSSIAFPLLYVLLGLRVVFFIFISIAIKRSAFNTKFKVYTIAAYACSALLVLFVLWSTHLILGLVEQYKPINSNEFMEDSIMHKQ